MRTNIRFILADGCIYEFTNWTWRRAWKRILAFHKRSEVLKTEEVIYNGPTS